MWAMKLRHLVIAALLFALLTLAIFWRYLGGTYLAGTDAMGPLADLEMIRAQSSYFESWRNITALGYMNFPSPAIHFIYYLGAGVLNLDTSLIWKIIIMVSFWLAGFLMFLCAYRITGKLTAALIAGLAYSMNQVFLSQVTEVHHYMIMGYALFPLLFLILYLTFKGETRYGTIGLPIVALASGLVGAPNTILITGVFIGLFTLFYAKFLQPGSGRERWTVLGVGLVCVVLVVLPMALMKYSGGGSSTLGVHYTLSEAGKYGSYSLYHSFIMASSENTYIFGTGGGQWTYPAVLFPVGLVMGLVIPVVALFAMRVRSQRALVLSLLIPALVFVIFANGTNPPFGGLFALAFDHVPLMDSLRVYSRLHLLTGFSYAILIALVLANLDEVRGASSLRWEWLKKVVRPIANEKGLAALIVVALLFPSSAIFVDEGPQTFDLPTKYMEPYVWLNDQDGDFRVLNLPFQAVYSVDPDGLVDGYPTAKTLDSGMYSPYISKKAYAYGVETQDFWSFVGDTLGRREYGYLDTMQMLGGMANVKYVVAQEQTSPEEVALFSSLHGLKLVKTFEGGSAIYEVADWKPSVNVLHRMVLVSGTRSALPAMMGLGLINLTEDGVLFTSSVSGIADLQNILSKVDLVVLTDADLVSLVGQLSWPEGETMELAKLADSHSADGRNGWIYSIGNYSSGIATEATADTWGPNKLEVGLTTEREGACDLLLSAVYGPDAGRLNISVDGHFVTALDLRSQYLREDWVRLSDLALEGTHHTVTLTNYGTGNTSLGRLILAPHEEVQTAIDQTSSLLEDNKDKVAYLVSAAHTSLWSDDTILQWSGDDGHGIAGTLLLTAADLRGSASLTLDPEAYGGLAANVVQGQSASTPLIYGLKSGHSYSIDVRLDASASSNASIEVWAGSESKTDLLVGDIGVMAAPGYSDQVLDFSLPEGLDQVQVVVSAGSGNISIDRLSLVPKEALTPTLTISTPFAGCYKMNVAGANASAIVTADGRAFAPLANGTGSYDIGHVSAGEHVITLPGDGTYALCLMPYNYTDPGSLATATFDHVSNVEYHVALNTSRPAWVVVSESYHDLWTATVNGASLEHVQADSMVNAYYLPGAGDLTMVVHFDGQNAYDSIILTLATILVTSTILIAFLVLLRTRGLAFWRVRPKG